MSERYDAIVVGAGPAGSAAALTMAQNNISVLLLERGQYPGSKNMYGGNIYSLPTAQIIPAFWEKAPWERKIVTEEIWFLNRDSAVKAGFTGLRFGKAPYNKFSALRPKFDSWFANEAVRAGAILRCNALAIDLIWDKIGLVAKKVDGIILDSGEEIRADVVVLAEGALAFLAQKAGLRKPLMAHSYTHYVKQVFGLPREKLESRFNLEKDEGTAIGMVGFATAGMIGKGGLWTNKETIGISTGGYLSQMVTKGLSPLHLLNRLTSHPLIKRLLEDAELLEYKSHMVPKGGYQKIPALIDHGIMVCGDAAMMISGRRGTDLAMLSGKAAGESVAEAHAKGSYTKDILQTYENKINHSFFLQDIRNGKASKLYYEHHPDSDYLLTKLINELAYKFFSVELKSNTELMQDMKEIVINLQPMDKTLKDLYHGIFNWGVF